MSSKVCPKPAWGLGMHSVKPIAERCWPCNRMRGFTLVELMVTLAVLAVLIGVAVPSFTAITHRNRLTAAANELVAAMQTARMEAIRRNSRVVLCPSTTGSSCGGTDWSRLIVFVDTNVSSDYDAGEVLVRDAQIVRTGTGVTAGSGTSRVWFTADGRVSVGGSSTASISLVSSKLPTTENARLVQASVSRISVCTSSGGSTSCKQ